MDNSPLIKFGPLYLRFPVGPKASAFILYLQDFPELFGSTPICDITYVQVKGAARFFHAPGQQALAIRSHFFEFIETDKWERGERLALTATQLETGKEYYILLYYFSRTFIVITSMTLSAWLVGTTKFLCWNFCIRVAISVLLQVRSFTESQVTDAALQSTLGENISLRFFTVIPEFRPEPHYQLWFGGNNNIK